MRTDLGNLARNIDLSVPDYYKLISKKGPVDGWPKD
jgi:hypothetical protein